MTRAFLQLSVLAILGAGQFAQAQERPRAPLGNGSGLTQMAPPFLGARRMLPKGLPTTEPALTDMAPSSITVPAVPTAATDVRISNFGNSVIAMSYWDGQSKWITFRIDPSASYDLTCPTCAQGIQLAYHDGTANKVVEVRKGSNYTITWSSNAWLLQSQATPSQ